MSWRVMVICTWSPHPVGDLAGGRAVGAVVRGGGRVPVQLPTRRRGGVRALGHAVTFVGGLVGGARVVLAGAVQRRLERAVAAEPRAGRAPQPPGDGLRAVSGVVAQACAVAEQLRLVLQVAHVPSSPSTPRPARPSTAQASCSRRKPLRCFFFFSVAAEVVVPGGGVRRAPLAAPPRPSRSAAVAFARHAFARSLNRRGGAVEVRGVVGAVPPAGIPNGRPPCAISRNASRCARYALPASPSVACWVSSGAAGLPGRRLGGVTPL